ncbi:helix-turn-helix transcriptional regulator [Shewanella atlantica]|uniref:LuxR family transcriptional regulator n=1 Tax=Shewanella atlantica TaxID=271099 RepID=A0A431WDH9_9GAMM|nr:helix-turn-helix transcriptional regulator [Shewanella atlantica]RTR33594.1 LuxR family transcriptional regulator [Shewanella atlantica]
MSNNKPKHCDIAPKYISFVREYLADYGVTEFFYGITIKMKPTTSEMFKKLRQRLPNEMLKARFMLCSSKAIMEYRHHYLSHFAAYDDGYFEKQNLGLNLLKNADITTPKGQQLQRLREEYGFQSWGAWRLPVKYNPNWEAVYVFFSDLDQATLRQNLQAHQEQIDHQLLLYSSLFNDQCIAQLNPISNFNCLSPKAIQVLELTAQGYSSEEIGEKLVMTKSGVHYHQNRLKELFNAKNQAQLVSSAHTLGVLE